MESEKFLRNWKSLKPLILAKWSKLKKSDLDEIQPILGELVGVIHAKYKDFSEQSIIEEIENVDQQILKND